MFMAIALMLEHLGYPQEARYVTAAVSRVSRSTVRTYDMGGSHTTAQVGEAIIGECVSMAALTSTERPISNSHLGATHVEAL
jgi:3-isopropylmalate dehydrogenase